MTVPSSNLLKTALSAIRPQTVTWRRFTGRDINAIGYDIANYAPAVDIPGSFQPVPRSMYERYGLDFQKIYATFYTSSPLLDIQRDVSGDRIEFCGKVYQVLSNNDWHGIDGWTGVLMVQIGDINVR